MNWIHYVSVPWLKARKDVLTASDVVKLVPEYKRVKAKKQDATTILPMFASVWCEKNTITEPDPVSTGAAARGHFMEPYAVQSYNEYQGEKVYHHWDDCIIKNLGLGFSPDAMDIKQAHDAVECEASDGGTQLVYHMEMDKKKNTIKSGDRFHAPKKILEIKSYSPAQHMKSILKKKMDHDELMQIAVAFAVLQKLEQATLLFYCPDCPIPVVPIIYERHELQKEIDIAVEIASMYAAQAAKLEEVAERLAHIKPVCSDAEVWKIEMTDDLGTRIR